jgi:polyisoprenoid-binding protein YceI
MLRRLLIAGTLLAITAVTASADTYTIDRSHSSVGFAVTHLGLGKVKGDFRDFAGTIDYVPGDISKSRVDATIQVPSIDTRDSSRDMHLKGSDFFAADSFPTMTFKSAKVTEKSGGKLEIVGDLTLRGITKPVTLDAELVGAMNDPWGNKRVSFSAHTKIDRMDYGVKWNKLLDVGGFVVGKEVIIQIEIEAVMKKQ